MMVTTSELGGSKPVKDEAATFRLISELTGDLILRFDLASKISFASPSAKAILDYAAVQAWRDRVWFAAAGMDPERADLPSVEAMLAEAG